MLSKPDGGVEVALSWLSLPSANGSETAMAAIRIVRKDNVDAMRERLIGTFRCEGESQEDALLAAESGPR
ncbi:MAG: hypothetical protein R3C68_05335 [Myxococcota bacterium]